MLGHSRPQRRKSSGCLPVPWTWCQPGIALAISSLSLSNYGLFFAQEFHYTDLDQIIYEDDLCLDVPKSKLKNPVEIQICHFMGGNQKWKYNNQVRRCVKDLCD